MIHSLVVVSYVMSLNQSEFIILREEFSNLKYFNSNGSRSGQ